MNEKPTTIVIFGASGDLTHRKLVPALYNLRRKGRLPEETTIVGFARRPYDDQVFRDGLREAAEKFSPDTFDPALWKAFETGLRYFQGNLTVQDDFNRLHTFLQEIENGPVDRLYYLATAPSFYEQNR